MIWTSTPSTGSGLVSTQTVGHGLLYRFSAGFEASLSQILVAYTHLLIAQALRGGQHIKSWGEFIKPARTTHQRVVLFMVVGVVDQDVENHAPEQLLLLRSHLVRPPHAANQLRQFGVADDLTCGPQCDMGGLDMLAL
jgi:hypothetical protein